MFVEAYPGGPGIRRNLARVEMIRDARAEVERVPAPPIRVVVGDERQMIAEALAALVGTLPGFRVTGVVAGAAGVCALAAEPPNLVLVGVEPSCRAGFELVQSIRVRMPEVEVVLVADALRPDLVKFVFEQRLGGLLLTDMSATDIATSLDEVANGRAVLPVGWQRMLADEQDDRLESLSDRQLEVLRLLAEGYSYEEIGARLFITLNTVKFHVRSIFVRLGVCNRMAAAHVLAQHPSQGRSNDVS